MAAPNHRLPDLSDDDRRGPQQFGRYRIIKRLGQGGMGSVYLAQDTHLERAVALKVPDFGKHDGPDARRRFLEEARTAATLDHPYLCPVYDAGEIDGQPYLTMAYIEGQSLATLIGDEGWPQRQVAALVGKLALAMQEAHTQKVIHRDLTPANVMIKKTGQRREPVIVDFGLARRDNPQEQRLTLSGQVMGTLGYMAPEQIRADLNEIGPASDIYALGVILYELLTGRLPFNGSELAVAAQILTEAPLPPSASRSDVEPALEAICLKAMAKAVGDRYSTMAELAAALTDLLQTPATNATPTASSGSLASPAPTRGERLPLAGSSALVDQFLAELAENQPSPVLVLTPEPVASREPLRKRRWPRWRLIAAASVLSALVVSIIVYVVTDKHPTKVPSGGPTIAVKVDNVAEETEEAAVSNPHERVNTPDLEEVAESNPIETKKSAIPETVAETGPWSDALSPVGPRPTVREPDLISTPELGSEATTVGFRPLFNGRDKSGWKTHPKEQGNWHVANGILIGEGPSISHLYTERGDYRDFHLRVEARVDQGAGGGVFFRAGYGPGWPPNAVKFPQGYEAGINGADKTPNQTGSLYANPPGGARASVAKSQHLPGEWFTMEVIAEGSHFVVKVNTKITAEYVDDQRRFATGHIALQQLDSQTKIEFRKIEIKELRGNALDAGKSPKGRPQRVSSKKPASSVAVPSPVDPPAIADRSDWNFKYIYDFGVGQGGAFRLEDGLIYHIGSPNAVGRAYFDGAGVLHLEFVAHRKIVNGEAVVYKVKNGHWSGTLSVNGQTCYFDMTKR